MKLKILITICLLNIFQLCNAQGVSCEASEITTILKNMNTSGKFVRVRQKPDSVQYSIAGKIHFAQNGNNILYYCQDSTIVLGRNCSEMFSGKNGFHFTEIDLSGFNFKRVTNMSGMFSNCEELKKVTYGLVISDSLKNMSTMFSHCTNLDSVDLSGFNTENVKLMNKMFCNCKNLKKVNLQNFNTEKVNNMLAMFLNCKQLEVLDISSFNTSRVYNMHGMFQQCNNLKTIYVSTNFVTKQAQGEQMFEGDTLLTGGKGTVCPGNYEESNIKFAKIDGNGGKGYFTEKKTE
ncbi:MAG: BspA family leucine-rich repeat surface protein [Bacteroidales bacterium]|nr:BspA family leucine-rich repeat surface protein [Bacteroidales bacterium]